MNFAIVALGGALGAMARYGISLHLPSFDASRHFPLATLMANTIGSLLIGFVIAALFAGGRLGEEWRLFMVVGLLGGFTTFSAFSLETLMLVQAGRPATAALYAVMSLVGIPALCAFGWWLGRAVS